MQMVTSIYILTEVRWPLAKSPKNVPRRDWRACYSATEKESRTASLCPHYHSLYTLFPSLASPSVGRGRLFFLTCPRSVPSVGPIAFHFTHPPSSLFSALSRHICCSSPPDLFFYFGLLVSFWLPTFFFLFTGYSLLQKGSKWASLAALTCT